ncbi:hypothetical protein FB45DRAFT_524024 [Roridomyces roridus]|uniref:Uncharacterized protein n=1 Tax=Roridomyces roridus TaxID=1738132 RepID=A0AAD7BXT9_9AGAR|nr:hypothetical protein FB45DRAFT_524024 [Roridomyces roridus]
MQQYPTSQPCRVCDCATKQWCSCCHTARYCQCSTEHAPGDPHAEPQSISVSAILFVAEEEHPRVGTTINSRPPHYRPSNGCPIPFLQPYFDPTPQSMVLAQGLNREPHRLLHIFYSPIALAKTSPINRAIYHIKFTGPAPEPWAGTVTESCGCGLHCPCSPCKC